MFVLLWNNPMDIPFYFIYDDDVDEKGDFLMEWWKVLIIVTSV